MVMTTTDQSTELQTVGAKPLVGSIPMSEAGLQLRSFDDMFRFAQAVVKSKDFCPPGLDTPEKVMLAIQTGMELGFSLMRSLSAVVIVKGRPSLYGEAIVSLIHDRGVCSRPPVFAVEGENDQRRGVCRFQRKNMPEPVETSFSVSDAKKAGLWNKSGSAWQTYPDDMLQWRALARAAKRYFGDVTMGLAAKEEMEDYPAVAPALEASPVEPDPLLLAAHPVQAGDVPQSLTETIDDDRSDLLTQIMLTGTALFKTNRALADLEISAATGGKVQSVVALEKDGTIDQVRQVIAHFDQMAAEKA